MCLFTALFSVLFWFGFVIFFPLCLNLKHEIYSLEKDIKAGNFVLIKKMFKYMFFFYCVCYYSYPPPPSTTPSFRQSPYCYLCPWAMLICSLASPFTFFYPVTPTPSTLTAISLFQVSMPLFLFCSLDSTYRLRSYGICLSLTGLFHLA